MNDIIKILELLEDLNVLIEGITEAVKHEIKKQEYKFLEALLTSLAASLVQPVISSVVKGTSGRGVTRAGRVYMDTISLVPLHPLNSIEITNYFNSEHRFNSVFQEIIYVK